ncbi:MI domain-containing protein [Caenorhabditis elegans]|uniref:MI domain-containing protein n=1 Tax=Caenorhabditis elegans TaxID=6239 RepID=Q9U255_CAEEL|nr:MI domain-containing protein [Caenorhabditis elegans]CAB63391.1 MI domain-containing protein [Caenorhabditis elegans]|eukprot:NP_492861.1 Uncharacterized protein CELE_Y52B11A.10 [Caenorhabditis elegans]
MKLPLFKKDGMSRKEQRKSAKQLKKMQAKAFSQRTPIEQVMRETMGMTKEDKKKRKRKRQLEAKKEQRKLEYLQNKNRNDGDSDDEEDMEDSEDEEEKKPTNRKGIVEVSVNKGKRKYGDDSEDSDEDLTYEQYMEEVQTATKKRRQEADGTEEDDAAIRKYGVLLGVNEQKKERDGKLKVPKSMKSDGLDLLLDFCDSERRKELMEDELDDDNMEDEEEFEDEEDEADESGNELDLSEGEEPVESEDDEDMVDEMMSDEEDNVDDEKIVEISDSEIETSAPKKSEETEDIYGRKINKSTGELIKFDPAAARKKLEELDATSSTGEQKQRVERAVNSIINKLSDAMLIKSQQGIAELWANSSKNDVKSALYKFLSKALLAPFRLQDSLLTTYGALIAMCHTMISNEISAHFVECFMCDLVKSMQEEEEMDDKSMENCVIFTAFLVVFRILQPSILIEIIDKLAENLNLTNLFAIRTLIAYAYKSLKKTSWPLVTQKIDEIHSEFEKKPISALPRAKFLLEEVILLKKSPPKAIDYDVVERQVKILHGITKKKGSSASSDSKELSMTLNDLLHAEQRGRWWIIGSAFRLPEQGGYGLLASASAAGQKKTGSFPPEMVSLATKAGMNSEVRRHIFCSVASADDEDDAFERLLKLQLKGEKERELVHVLIAMMMKEKTYNAFYATLLQRFCEFNKRFVITLQFALWDRLRECDQLKPFQRGSLAQLLQHLISNEVMSITVLKTVEWATRSARLTTILKKLFLGLAKSPESVLKRVFEPVIDQQKRTKFELLSEGMRVFWHMNLNDFAAYQKIDKWIMESGYD